MRLFAAVLLAVVIGGFSTLAFSVEDSASKQAYERRKAEQEKRLEKEQAEKVTQRKIQERKTQEKIAKRKADEKKSCAIGGRPQSDREKVQRCRNGSKGCGQESRSGRRRPQG